MRSLGYDNISLLIYLTKKEWSTVKGACKFQGYKKQNTFALMKDTIYFETYNSFTKKSQCQTISDHLNDLLESLSVPNKTQGGVQILCHINVPKLINGHNIKLAGPTQLKEALEKCERLLPIQISLSSAIVRSVHFTYIQDTEFAFPLWKPHFRKANGGKWVVNELENGIYFNGSRCTILVYGKDEQFRRKGKAIPKDVLAECDHKHLIRFEIRIEKQLLTQLKDRGYWVNSTLIGSDLYSSDGFLAFVHFFEWEAPRFIIPGAKKKKPSAMERLFLSSPEKAFRLYKKECKHGRTLDQDYQQAYIDFLSFRSQQRPEELLAGITLECKSAYECFTKAITGNIEAKELSYVRS